MAQEDGVGEAENGAVGADAEGQREDGNCGEAGILEQDADGVSDVLNECNHGTPLRSRSRRQSRIRWSSGSTCCAAESMGNTLVGRGLFRQSEDEFR